jgi:hypothetical protein
MTSTCSWRSGRVDKFALNERLALTLSAPPTAATATLPTLSRKPRPPLTSNWYFMLRGEKRGAIVGLLTTEFLQRCAALSTKETKQGVFNAAAEGDDLEQLAHLGGRDELLCGADNGEIASRIFGRCACQHFG